MKKWMVPVLSFTIALSLWQTSGAASFGDESAGGILPAVAGEGTTYVNLFDVILDEAYYPLWYDCCAAVVGEENAEATVSGLQGSISSPLYGEGAIEAFAEGGMAFDCFYINDAASFTFEEDTVTIEKTDGTSETHTYEYLGQYEIGAGETMEYMGEEMSLAFPCDVYQSTEEAGEFNYIFLREDTMDETYHIEFRYGKDLEELQGYRVGPYAYWLAAGIDAEADEETIKDVIELFCLENMDYSAHTPEALSQLENLGFIGKWTADFSEFGEEYADTELYFTLDEAGHGITMMDGAPTADFEAYAYDNGEKEDGEGLYVAFSNLEGEAEAAKYTLETNDAGESVLTFYADDGVISYIKDKDAEEVDDDSAEEAEADDDADDKAVEEAADQAGDKAVEEAADQADDMAGEEAADQADDMAGEEAVDEAAADEAVPAADVAAEEKIEISSVEDLMAVNENLSADYVLTADLDLQGAEWTPLGSFVPQGEEGEEQELPSLEYAFTGTFDGAEHTISNLKINQPENYVIGLFGCIANAQVGNFTLENADIAGMTMAGDAVGYAYCSTVHDITLLNGKVTACESDEEIAQEGMFGGIVAAGMGSRIEGCTAQADIVIPDNSANAGIVGGGLEGTSLADCSASGTVTAGAACYGLGGVSGCGFGAEEFTNCSAKDVTITAGEGSFWIGGITGYAGGYEDESFGVPVTVFSGCAADNVDIQAPEEAEGVGEIVGSGFFFEEMAAYGAPYDAPTVYVIEE